MTSCKKYNEGKYKLWNGLLEWNTGMDYYTRSLYSFFGQVSVFICRKRKPALKLASSYHAWMIVNNSFHTNNHNSKAGTQLS